MTSKFTEAVETIAILSKNYVKNGQIVLQRCEPETFILQAKLGIRFDGFSDDPEKIENHEDHYYCTDEAADILLEICEENAAAFDLCKRIAAHGLLTERALPPALQKFSGYYLADLVERPKGTKRSITWLRNIYLLTLVWLAQKRFELKMTRNVAAHNEISACDAVSLGLAENGHSITFRAISELCIGTKKEQKELRNDFNDWLHEIMSGLENGEILERQLASSWLAPIVM